MSSHSLNAAISELDAALTVMDPPIEGLSNIAAGVLTEATMSFVLADLSRRTRRRALCRAAVSALHAVVDDGFPEMPATSVPVAAVNELQTELQTISLAISQFIPLASMIRISLGDPETKPQKDA